MVAMASRLDLVHRHTSAERRRHGAYKRVCPARILSLSLTLSQRSVLFEWRYESDIRAALTNYLQKENNEKKRFIFNEVV